MPTVMYPAFQTSPLDICAVPCRSQYTWAGKKQVDRRLVMRFQVMMVTFSAWLRSVGAPGSSPTSRPISSFALAAAAVPACCWGGNSCAFPDPRVSWLLLPLDDNGRLSDPNAAAAALDGFGLEPRLAFSSSYTFLWVCRQGVERCVSAPRCSVHCYGGVVRVTQHLTSHSSTKQRAMKVEPRCPKRVARSRKACCWVD